MEERAIENGILDKAFENAKNIIRKIIDNDLVEELGYTVCLKPLNEAYPNKIRMKTY